MCTHMVSALNYKNALRYTTIVYACFGHLERVLDVKPWKLNSEEIRRIFPMYYFVTAPNLLSSCSSPLLADYPHKKNPVWPKSLPFMT